MEIECLLVIFLLLQMNGKTLGLKETHRSRDCESPTVIVAAVEQTQAGIRITSTSAVPDNVNVEDDVVTELPGGVVPQEVCGQDYIRCPLECRRELDNLFCTLPIRNDTQNYLALVKFKHTSDGFEQLEQVCVPPKATCVPLQVFVSRLDLGLQYFVPCLNTTSDNPFLYFEELKLFMTNLTRSSLVDDSYISRHFIEITGESLSQLVYQDRDDTNCFPKCIVFFKDGSQVLQFRIFDEEAIFYHLPMPIENCPYTEQFDAFEPDRLRIQCSADNVLVYDPCNAVGVVDQYNTTINATVFQCSTADVNVFHYQGNLTFKSYGSGSDDIIINDIMLPFNDTRNIQCAGRNIPMLFITRSNGETYLVNPSSGAVHYLAGNTCGAHLCVNLNVLEIDSSTIVGFFDYSNNTYTVLNLTCPDSPVISRIPYGSPPILFSLMYSSKSQPCPVCASFPPDPKTPDTLNPNDTGSPSVHTNTQADDGPGLVVNDDRTSLFIGATGGVAVVLLLIVVVMVLIIALIVKR